ncbi:hypothetical protein [uncultured Maribacter sp.]|uniref:hypothetical protein n=1 Tax=uncultured Maribacter sp. TaxID=431308 RepID=UPI0026111666|nr:hypothetical protein [uncultured Maribacter sp.]
MKQISNFIFFKIYIILFIFGFQFVSAQIKIGNNPNTIDASSVLELESTSHAFVITRVTTTEMLSITPLQGGIVYNTDEQCVFYFNGVQWRNLCQNSGNSISITDNTDGTYTVNDGTNPPFTFNGAAETTSTLDANTDGSFTYTNEIGDTTTIPASSRTSSLTITNNTDGTYTVDDSINTPYTFNGGLSSLQNNGSGNYTFTNEIGTTTTFSTSGGGSNITGTAGSIFFADGTTAIENNNELFWDNNNNRLGIGTNNNINNKLVVNGDIGSTQLLLNNGNQEINPSSLIIRGTGPDQRMISFQDANLGNTLFNINFRGAGLNIDEINKQHRLFIKILGGMGIETRTPTETLDVNGTFRVRNLGNTVAGDNYVTVDADGVFHRSTSTAARQSNNIKLNGARWTNNNTSPINLDKDFIIPLFGIENYKDGGSNTYNVLKKRLQILESGRYTITANVSLVLKNTSSIAQNINARLLINGTPKGSLNSIINDNKTEIIQSIAINDILQLNANDILCIQITTNGKTEDILINTRGSSSFTITRIK